MPLHLDTKRLYTNRTERVKCVDLHPTEPWVLSALFSGVVQIANYSTQQILKSVTACDLPVRAAKFIARKQWFVCGSDDQFVRVFNYNTMEKVKSFEAHNDYIRCIAIHPSKPLILTSSDDMTIKVWDWERGFMLVQTFEGHGHFVMDVAINAKDPNTFASASLDRTVKVWGLGSSVPHFTLEGHAKGVNCVAYYQGGDKPYVVSGADDQTVRVWDYHTKQCVQVLHGHFHNVSCVTFHPELPIILSGSEDGTVRVWHSGTYRLESTLNSAMERCWTLGCQRGSNKVAAGYDGGTVVLKFGSEEPVASMDGSGKVVMVRNSEIKQLNVRSAQAPVEDAESLILAQKDLGSSEVFPQSVRHNKNGRFVCVCGDGEYIIYTALAWRNHAFGSALDFCWSNDPGEYAVRENSFSIRVYQNFKEKFSIRPKFSVERIFGGHLFSAVSSSFLSVHSWEDLSPIRRIAVVPKNVLWSDSGELMAIICESSFYILRYSREAVLTHLESGAPTPEEGIDNAFDMLFEIAECATSACFVGNTFVYVNKKWRVNYCINGEVTVVAHVDRPVYVLGYLPELNRLYLVDRSQNVVSYHLSHLLIEYEDAVARQDMETAAKLLPSIPPEQKNQIARFLEAQGHKELALEVATDSEQKFELAVSLSRLDIAETLAEELDSKLKWKQLADLALAAQNLKLCEKAMGLAGDYAGLLLLYSSLGDSAGLERLGEQALRDGFQNVGFQCKFLLHKLGACHELLVRAGRLGEADFFERAYMGGEDLLGREEDEASPVASDIASAETEGQAEPEATEETHS